MHHVVLSASKRTPLQPAPCGVDVIVCCKGQQRCMLLSQAAKGRSLQGELIALWCRGQHWLVQGGVATGVSCVSE